MAFGSELKNLASCDAQSQTMVTLVLRTGEAVDGLAGVFSEVWAPKVSVVADVG